jgi:hypothetical protein
MERLGLTNKPGLRRRLAGRPITGLAGMKAGNDR